MIPPHAVPAASVEDKRMTIAITGASGGLGRSVAERVLDHAEPSDVVLISRRPERLDDLAERGAEVRCADVDDPHALAGVETVLLLGTHALDREARVRRLGAGVSAVLASRARHIVYASLPTPLERGDLAAMDREQQESERLVSDSGRAWTILRSSLFAELQAGAIKTAVATGELRTNAGKGRVAYVSSDDCAAATAAVLAGAGREGRVYDITGPALVSAEELAEIASELADVPVRAVHVGDDALVRGLMASGLPEPTAHAVAAFGIATREGRLRQLSPAVEQLTGRPARPVRDVLIAAGTLAR
jgi:NAD(P)H dehydrogenase (quinone)